MKKHPKYKLIGKDQIWCPYQQTYGDIYSDRDLIEFQEDCSDYVELKMIASTPLFIGGMGCERCRYYTKGGMYNIGCSYEYKNGFMKNT